MRSTCTRRPRTSSSTSGEERFEGRVDGGDGRRRPRGLLIVGWIGVLALVVGVALAGRPSAAPEAVAFALTTPSAVPSAASSAVPSASPTRRPAPRTAPGWATGQPRTVLLVRGIVPRRADDLRVRLETARGMELVVSPLDPTGHGHGGVVPFEASFSIAHRPTGADPPLFVVVVDAADRPVELTRHAYSSSLFLDLRAAASRPRSDRPAAVGGAGAAGGGTAADRIPTPAPPTPPRPRGNDGLVGGIAFGIPFAER